MFLKIYYLRESRAGEIIPSRLPAEHRAQCWLDPATLPHSVPLPHNSQITPGVEMKSQLLNPLSHPTAPTPYFYFLLFHHSVLIDESQNLCRDRVPADRCFLAHARGAQLRGPRDLLQGTARNLVMGGGLMRAKASSRSRPTMPVLP